MENIDVADIWELADNELDLVAGGSFSMPNINVVLAPITIQTGVGIGVETNVAVLSHNFSQGGKVTVVVGNFTFA